MRSNIFLAVIFAGYSTNSKLIALLPIKCKGFFCATPSQTVSAAYLGRQKLEVLESEEVGDKVAFTFGLTRAEGVIIEDRGPIGKGGRRLYLIRFSFSEGDPMTIPLAAADLERLEN